MKNLLPGTTYNIYVTATNDFGTSPASASWTCTTFSVPFAPIPACGVAGSNSLTVSWTDTANDGGVPVLSYTVAYEPVGSFNSNLRQSQTIYSSGNSNTFLGRQYTINGLEQATDYSIFVTATNDFGDSVASNSVVCSTIGVAPAPPIPLCGLSTSSSINVSWQDGFSDGGSFINDYTIWYQPVTSLNNND